MATVLFKGWNYGLQKISLTKVFQLKADLTLKEAIERTDSLLDRKTFLIETESIEQATELVEAATAIGAVCAIIKDND